MSARARPHRASAPPLRWSALLVFGLLVGLLGMHALGPGGVPSPRGQHAVSASPAHAHSAAAAVTDATGDADEDADGASACHSGDADSGHARHADVHCASGAVGDGPVLPVPLSDPGARTLTRVGGTGMAVSSPQGGPAPPSLARLQLLRV
ncbi:DUF6153 family protein [Streptomyces sp. NPDC006997]|uniref:DUF6153 family protein n=1 Tax=Streptomyces sp. NPDC006997 TaxID=3155356 RepID=UPI00340D57B6